jgi:oligopeptide transport system substrate-binding protein
LALFEGLVVNDPVTCHALPGVAESWSLSPDGLTLRFKLRADARWSDGRPLVARDFVEGWLRTLDPATGSEYAYLIGLVVRGAQAYNEDGGPREDVAVKAIDDRTLEVGLVGPAPYAVDLMANYAFSPLPMAAIAKYGDEWARPEHLVGNGPYTLREWQPGRYILVVKNDKYWDAKNVRLRSIEFVPVEDEESGYDLFKGGRIDWEANPPYARVEEMRSRKDFQLSPANSVYYYIFNMAKEPLTDVRVRKALAMAVDKRALVDRILKGGQLPTDSFVPPQAGYGSAKGNPLDLDAARKLLAEAGFPNGEGFPKLTILYNTNENHKKIAEFVREEWKRNLGVEVVLRNQEWKTFLDARSKTHDFQIARAGWIGDYLDPNAFLDMFLLDSGNNDGLYKNPRYDELVKKAMTMPLGAERLAVLAEAEDLLIGQDQAIMPFYFYASGNLIDTDKWAGWSSNPLDIHPWKFIYRK